MGIAFEVCLILELNLNARGPDDITGRGWLSLIASDLFYFSDN